MNEKPKSIPIEEIFGNERNELPRCLEQGVTTVEHYLEILREVEVEKIKTKYGTLMRQGKIPRISVDDVWLRINPMYRKRGYIELLRTIFYKDPYRMGMKQFLDDYLPYPEFYAMVETIDNALEYALTERESKIIKMYLGLDDYLEMPYADIALKLSCTRTTVANTYNLAIEKLQIYENKIQFLKTNCKLLNIGVLTDNRLEKSLIYNFMYLGCDLNSLNEPNISSDVLKSITDPDDKRITEDMLRHQAKLSKKFRNEITENTICIRINDDFYDSIYSLDFGKNLRTKIINYIRSKNYGILRLSFLAKIFDEEGWHLFLSTLTDSESERFIDKIKNVALLDENNNWRFII